MLFDGAPSDSDDDEVAVTFTSFGDEVINVVATTDESGAVIHGSLDLKIIGIEDVTFAFDSGK